METIPTPILAAHRTIREFRLEKISEDLLLRLLWEAQRASTDATAQLYSIIRIVDAKLRERIAAISGEQKHIINAPEFFIACADLHRLDLVLKRRGHTPGRFPTSGLHFALLDAGLAAQRLADAAEAVGLGVCFIGGILSGIDELTEILALPPKVLPVVGLCVGWPDEDPPLRPRVALASVLHVDRYKNPSAVELEADITTMAAITRGRDWVEVLARYFAQDGVMENREDGLRVVLRRQDLAP